MTLRLTNINPDKTLNCLLTTDSVNTFFDTQQPPLTPIQKEEAVNEAAHKWLQQGFFRGAYVIALASPSEWFRYENSREILQKLEETQKVDTLYHLYHIARDLPDETMRSEALYEIVCSCINLKAFPEAICTAMGSLNEERKAYSFSAIAIGLCKEENMEGALGAIAMISDKKLQDETLYQCCRILEAQENPDTLWQVIPKISENFRDDAVASAVRAYAKISNFQFALYASTYIIAPIKKLSSIFEIVKIALKLGEVESAFDIAEETKHPLALKEVAYAFLEKKKLRTSLPHDTSSD